MNHRLCDYMMSGFFMSDGLRNCMRRGKFEVSGKIYCAQHVKIIERRIAIRNNSDGKHIVQEK